MSGTGFVSADPRVEPEDNGTGESRSRVKPSARWYKHGFWHRPGPDAAGTPSGPLPGHAIPPERARMRNRSITTRCAVKYMPSIVIVRREGTPSTAGPRCTNDFKIRRSVAGSRQDNNVSRHLSFKTARPAINP